MASDNAIGIRMGAGTLKRARKALPYIGLLLFSLAVYLPVMDAASRRRIDFGMYIRIAQALPHTDSVSSHVLYQAMLKLAQALLPGIAPTTAALIAVLVYMLPLPLILFWLLKRATEARLPDALLGALALGLTIAAPLTRWANDYMTGYINPVLYHSPTQMTLRLFLAPIALIALRAFADAANADRKRRLWLTLLCADLVLLATLAQPSYTLVLLPGCVMLAGWRWLRGLAVDWLTLIVGVILPGAAIMSLQYLITFGAASAPSSIAPGFLVYQQAWLPAWQLPYQLLFSIAFPLSLLPLYGRAALRDKLLALSWLVFCISLVPAYFFYEEGYRLMHGNLARSSYAAVFVLLFASLCFLLRQLVADRRTGVGWRLAGVAVSSRAAAGMAMFALHLLSGASYYLRFLHEWTPM